MRSTTKKHTKDALIATTAEKYADALVTEDKRFASRFGKLCSACDIWSYVQFKQYVLNKK
jgi:predicted nucleic acid-binding protein